MATHIPRPMHHMLPEDREIWARFLSHFEDQFDRYEYDVLTGPKLEVPSEELPPNLRTLAERLFALRIDVLAKRNREVWIIEVKPNAGLSALGQLLAYQHYMVEQVGDASRIHLACVTDFIRHYMPPLYERYGIWCLAITEDGRVGLLPPGPAHQGIPFVQLPERYIIGPEAVVWPSEAQS